MITKKEIEKLANLAKLKLTEKEKEQLSFELSRILDYVRQLQEVKIGEEEWNYFKWHKQKLRGDKNSLNFEFKNNLLDGFLEKKERFLKTKKIL